VNFILYLLINPKMQYLQFWVEVDQVTRLNL
jgi:hypothetical protein